MPRVRIDFAYDGSRFRGFAAQHDQRTVGGVLQDALERLGGAAVDLTVAGRTDAGVHASYQTLHTDIPEGSRLLDDLSRARRALDRMCGPEIAVWRMREVPASFDARFSATMRRYRYRVCDASAMDPMWRHHTWHAGEPPLDVEAMHAAGQHLVGEHDFSSFCRRASVEQHLRRRVDVVWVRRRPHGLVEVAVEGPAFCHQMVRSLVGCLLRVGRGQRSPAWVPEVIAARDRTVVGQVAPPHGLTLVGVTYPS